MPGRNREMPILKNNNQRREFVDNYKEWPVWFEVKEASEVYYRLDLKDGSSLVICEYKYFCEWMSKYTNDDPNKTGVREYLLKPGYKHLHDCRSSKTELITHLKNVQKVQNE